MPDRGSTIHINGAIVHREVRVISADGAMLGVMATKDALRMAAEQGFSLVEVNPAASPPVCKIMHWPHGPPLPDETA